MSSGISDYLESARKKKEAELARKISAYERATAAVAKQDYKHAFEILMGAFMPNEPDEIYNWGVTYMNGVGVKKDEHAAVKWFLEADKAGSVSASRVLGAVYYYGMGVDKDLSLAALYTRKAADAGDPDAQFNLAVLYNKGEGVVEDPKSALEWFQKAAQNHHKHSAVIVGNAYFRGKNVPRSFPLAWYWLSDFERSTADTNEDFFYQAQCLIGMMYLHGKGTEINYEKAKACLIRAADHGDREAQFWLGMMYFSGKGVAQSLEIAKSWLQKSAEQEFQDAVEFLNADNMPEQARLVWEKVEQEVDE